MMIPHFGPVELIIILLIVVMIFGAGKLADLGGAIGRSVREFRKAAAEERRELSQERDESRPV